MGIDVAAALLGNRLREFHAGKVRHTYELPGYPDLLLVLATDRLSTHNVVHRSQIPQKGVILTALTVFWFRELLAKTPNHLVAAGHDIHRYLPSSCRGVQGLEGIEYRALVVERLRMIPVEFVVREYLTGSLLNAYEARRDPYGLSLPPGLLEMSRLPNAPILTPTDKSETDDPLLSSDILGKYPRECALVRQTFLRVQKFLAQKGLTIVDSKCELGLRPDGTVVFGDEVFTTDSSRFVKTDSICEGEAPNPLDKQHFRNIAERTWGTGPVRPLRFSDEAVDTGVRIMRNLLEMVTSHSLSEWKAGHLFDYHR